jgi:hypothetical protein
MSAVSIRPVIVCLLACLGSAAPADGQVTDQDSNRSAIIAALETLMATGEPRHTAHDEGQRLQLAVDAALSRGDAEIERLAVRAATPLIASVTRPINAIHDLPSIEFSANDVLRVRRPVPYTARMFASIDGGDFTFVEVVESGKGHAGRIDTMLPEPATRQGFHVIRLRAEMEFGKEGSSPWTESRTLAPLFYVIYDPASNASASVRALVYAPASTPAKEFDPRLGDEPFAVWLSGVLSARHNARDFAPEWWSDYCDERTEEAGRKTAPTAICAVVGFQSRGEIGQLWFRTADIRETERGIEWVPLSPARFEGMTLNHTPDTGGLAALPSLLDTAPESRPGGDISILPDDIVLTSAPPTSEAPADVAVTVRNIGQTDLQKVLVMIAWGVDANARPTNRQFVVDVPAQGTAAIKLQVAFPNGYGFVMAQASTLGEHSPAGTWTPDPTPDDDCAMRIVNAKLAPPRYRATLLEATGPGCTAK